MVVVIYYSFCKFELDDNKLFTKIKHIFKMSSIYKKGRDGYYYYQTYLNNPKTNKKNKRVYHSLGTKDLVEAEKKKVLLDKKYSESNSILKFLKISISKAKIITLATFMTLIVVYNPFTVKNSINLSPKLVHLNDNNIVDVTYLEKKEDIIIVEKDSSVLSLSSKVKKEEEKFELPQYEIEKIEKLEGAFNQIKIHATIDENVSKDIKLLLCSFLRKEFSQFTNVIVCLYSNEKIGEFYVDSSLPKLIEERRKKNWLAMYTFNPVEGEYFDDMPDNYDGIY
jgi:hypothetical protein